jgi:hypothetical protein
MSDSLRIDLTTLFLSISSAAMMGLGDSLNLELVQQNIQLLELLQEKTKGNRSVDEDKLIEQLLYEIRMRYLEVQKK